MSKVKDELRAELMHKLQFLVDNGVDIYHDCGVFEYELYDYLAEWETTYDLKRLKSSVNSTLKRYGYHHLVY